VNFIHALKWSFFSELTGKLIQPVVFVVLARLLTPEDFGVMTSILFVHSAIAFTDALTIKAGCVKSAGDDHAQVI